MAKLISEDENVQTSFEIILLKDKIEKRPNISWVPYKIILESSDKKLVYERENNNQGAGDYVLSLEPINEIKNIISGMKTFLESKTQNLFSFEPIEPSFELIIEKAHEGYSVTCWADAGNVDSDHYAWDGFGLRFFTKEDKIKMFVSELENDCRGLINQTPTKDIDA